MTLLCFFLFILHYSVVSFMQKTTLAFKLLCYLLIYLFADKSCTQSIINKDRELDGSVV